MNLGLYLVLLILASIATVLVILVGSEGRIGSVRVDRRTGIIISAFVLIMWGVLVVNSFEVVVHSGGEQTVEEYPELAWLGAGGGAAALLVMLKAAIEEINATGGI